MHPEATGELSGILYDMALAAKMISSRVRRAGLADILGSTQIERIATEHGAALESCPILLGALFKEIGTADIPLFQMSPPRTRWFLKDMTDWAKAWGRSARDNNDSDINWGMRIGALGQVFDEPARWDAAGVVPV